MPSNDASLLAGPLSASARRITLLAVLLVGSATCTESPWEPRPVERSLITPPIVDDILIGGGWQPNDAISFHVRAASDTYQMPDASYYPIRVWSNKGESEDVHAVSSACYENADRVYVCDAFQVRIAAEADPAAALAAATSANARLLRWDWWPDSAVFHSFSNLAQAMRAVRGHEGVTRVGLWYLDSIGLDAVAFRRFATATLRVDFGTTPTPNDGLFTVMPGDSVFARVSQPGGNYTRAFQLW